MYDAGWPVIYRAAQHKGEARLLGQDMNGALVTHVDREKLCPLSSVCGGVGGAGSGQYEPRGVPLPEGGLRYAIHPVTGQLVTSETQPVSLDMLPTAAHKAHREDRTIIKACHCGSSCHGVVTDHICAVQLSRRTSIQPLASEPNTSVDDA